MVRMPSTDSAMKGRAGVGLSVARRADGTSSILRHLRTMFAFRPWGRAMLAREASGLLDQLLDLQGLRYGADWGASW